MANASLKFRSTGVHSSTVQLGNTELWTLFSLLLGGIIENQNSDFVTVPGYRAHLALYGDEVRILIFDRMTEN